MTNFERWHFFMKDITSPESFIDFGFYSLIGSALQRKVWCGYERNPLFANMYTGLVGPASVGKGRVIKEVEKILRFHKLKEAGDNIMHNEDTSTDDAVGDVKKKTRRNIEPPLLIPVGVDTATFEALVLRLEKSSRGCWYQNGESKKSLYMHSSLSVCLEEMQTMFRKHVEDLMALFLKAYDCGEYRYETKTQGANNVKNCCLNLLFGTTHKFMKTIFNDELIDQGFSSRTCFISEEFPRSYRCTPPEYSKEQIEEYDILVEHVRKLTEMYGELKFTLEAKEYMEIWWRTDAQTKRPNNHPKLAPYYGRKNILMQKMAMIKRCMDNATLDGEVTLDDCLWSINTLAKVEIKMHKAVLLDTKNPLAQVTEDILEFLKKNGPHKRGDIVFEFYSSLPDGQKSLDDIIKYLSMTNKIKLTTGDRFEAI